MAQEKTHEFAKEINILRQTARQLRNYKAIPHKIYFLDKSSKETVIYTAKIVDKSYKIIIKEI